MELSEGVQLREGMDLMERVELREDLVKGGVVQ